MAHGAGCVLYALSPLETGQLLLLIVRQLGSGLTHRTLGRVYIYGLARGLLSRESLFFQAFLRYALVSCEYSADFCRRFELVYRRNCVRECVRFSFAASAMIYIMHGARSCCVLCVYIYVYIYFRFSLLPFRIYPDN